MNYDFIYFIGDSYTFAILQKDDVLNEVTEKNRFSGLIGSHYNIPVINEGMAGCSNQTIFRKIYEDVYRFVNDGKKFLVVISYTDITRMELYNNKQRKNVTISDHFSFFKDYLIESHNLENCKFITTSYILAIHTLLERFNIDYVEAYTNEIIKVPYMNKNKCLDKTFMEITGLDGRFSLNGHANVLGNDRIAKAFIQKINELYGTN